MNSGMGRTSRPPQNVCFAVVAAMNAGNPTVVECCWADANGGQMRDTRSMMG
jgi:hypothetical protein